MAGGKQLQDFFKQARCRDVSQQRGQFSDRSFGFWLYIKAKLGGKADGAKHANRIFPVAGFGVSNQAELPVTEVFNAVGKINDGEIADAVVKGVDRKIAAQRIFLLVAVNIVPQQQTMFAGFAIVVWTVVVGFRRVTTECGHFNHFAPEYNVNDPKTPTYQAGVAEQVVYFFRGGVGGYIKIFGLLPQKDVAYTAAYKVSLITGIVESTENFLGRLAYNRA